MAQGGPIIDPCTDDPADHLLFDYDPVTRITTVCGTTPRGEVTVAVLQLNRAELRRERNRQVSGLAVLARLAADGDAQAASLLAEARGDEAPYAAFARGL